ncbi:unnamed protein product [Pedinophyceae sp. YPF-701]|nr:unnamed protein product [Pedinophyceae sp. YPF-701]
MSPVLVYPTARAPRQRLEDGVQKRLEDEAARYWDAFYRVNEDRFFKDRHYLAAEFPELAAGPCVVLEVGCGVGNTVAPLLHDNAQAAVHCCDFSPRAVEIVRAHEMYATGRVNAFVADIVRDDLPRTGGVAPGSVDVCTMIFVLSAVAPRRMRAALANVAQCLKEGGGVVAFRDYAEGDLAQMRFTGEWQRGGGASVRERRRQMGSDEGRFYARGDGTCCHFFNEEDLAALFESVGFERRYVRTIEKVVENKAKKVSMYRRWIQAVFVLRDRQRAQEVLRQPRSPSSEPSQPARDEGAQVSCGHIWREFVARLASVGECPAAGRSVRVLHASEDDGREGCGCTLECSRQGASLKGHGGAEVVFFCDKITHPDPDDIMRRCAAAMKRHVGARAYLMIDCDTAHPLSHDLGEAARLRGLRTPAANGFERWALGGAPVHLCLLQWHPLSL